jgi:hypothetical protein
MANFQQPIAGEGVPAIVLIGCSDCPKCSTIPMTLEEAVNFKKKNLNKAEQCKNCGTTFLLDAIGVGGVVSGKDQIVNVETLYVPVMNVDTRIALQQMMELVADED